MNVQNGNNANLQTHLLRLSLIHISITTSIGILLHAIGKDAVKSLNRRDGYVIVSVAWVTFALFGMLPYYIGGYIPSVTDAFFETMSLSLIHI